MLTGAGAGTALATGGGGATGWAGEVTGAVLTIICDAGAVGVAARGASCRTGATGWAGFGATGGAILAGEGGLI